MQAVQAAADWGMGRVHFESDSQNLVRALQSTDFDLAPEGIIYRDIRSFVMLHFISAEFLFCPWGCNKVAHALAVLGAGQSKAKMLWPESVPNSVSDLVASEFAEPI
jgi:hypothetical protein